ncbi:MAG TPA: sugar phosphate isomerase/epimerase [Gemmatimonadales bacterium]|nr:sugar phosphate isomerase/epimerase [Gemmatimonadales bacterium]
MTALAVVTGWRRYAAPARARLRFGYAAITWNGNDRQAIDEIASLGFRGIQLRQPAVETWGERPAELKRLLADRKLTFVALSSGDVSLDPAAEESILTQHTRHAQFVRDAGGMYLQVIDQRPSNRDPTADDYRRMGQLLTEIGRRSAELGIPLGYHNHMGALGQSAEEVARVLDAADPRYVRLLLDIAHLQRAGGDPAQAIRQHAGRLLFLHIKDVDDSGRFVELGRGKVDLAAVFAALDEIGFDGWGVVELDSVPDATRTPKESGAIARRYLEAAGRWTTAR